MITRAPLLVIGFLSLSFNPANMVSTISKRGRLQYVGRCKEKGQFILRLFFSYKSYVFPR